MQIQVLQPGLYVRSIATSIYTCAHALKLNYRPSGRRVSQYQERGAKRSMVTLNYSYTTVELKRHQGHRRTRGGVKETPEGLEGTRGIQIQETPEGPEVTAKGSGETPRGPGWSERATRSEGSNKTPGHYLTFFNGYRTALCTAQ
jgi:hypothetical protein